VVDLFLICIHIQQYLRLGMMRVQYRE